MQSDTTPPPLSDKQRVIVWLLLWGTLLSLIIAGALIYNSVDAERQPRVERTEITPSSIVNGKRVE